MSTVELVSHEVDGMHFPASFTFFLEEENMSGLESFLGDISQYDIFELRRMVLDGSSTTLDSRLTVRETTLLRQHFAEYEYIPARTPGASGDVTDLGAGSFGASSDFADFDGTEPSKEPTFDDSPSSDLWADDFPFGETPKVFRNTVDVRGTLFRGVFLDTHVHGGLSDVGGHVRQTMRDMRSHFAALFPDDGDVRNFFDEATNLGDAISKINYFDIKALEEDVRRLIIAPLRAGRVVCFSHAVENHAMFVVADPVENTFALLNTGKGTNFHYSVPTSIKCKYQIPHVYDLSLDVRFWTCLLRTTQEWEPAAGVYRPFRASQVRVVYEIVLPMLGLPRRIEGCDWSPQYSGTCFYKSIKAGLHYVLRGRSEGWKSMIFRFRKAVLEGIEWGRALTSSDVKVVTVAFQKLLGAAEKLRRQGKLPDSVEELRQKVERLRAVDDPEPPAGVQLEDVGEILKHRPSRLDAADSKVPGLTYPDYVSLDYCRGLVRDCAMGRTVPPSASARLWSACAAVVDRVQLSELKDLCAVAQYLFIAYATMPAPSADLRFETLVYLKRVLTRAEEMQGWGLLTEFPTEGISSNPGIVRLHVELSGRRGEPIFSFASDSMTLQESARFYDFCLAMMGLDVGARDQIKEKMRRRDVPEAFGQALEIVCLCQFVSRYEAPARPLSKIESWPLEDGALTWAVDRDFRFSNQWLQPRGVGDRDALRPIPKLAYDERRAYKVHRYDRDAAWGDGVYGKIFPDKKELGDFLVSMEGGPLTALYFFLPRARQDYLKYVDVQKALERAVFYVPDLSPQSVADDSEEGLLGESEDFKTRVRFLSSRWKTTPLLTLSGSRSLFVAVLQELQPSNPKAAFFCAALACRVAQMLDFPAVEPTHGAATYVRALKGMWRDRVEVLLRFNYQKGVRGVQCGLARPDVRALLYDHFVGQGALRASLRRELEEEGAFKLASQELSAWLNQISGVNSDAPWVPRGFVCPLTVETRHPPLYDEKITVDLRGVVYLHFDRRCGAYDAVRVNGVEYFQAFPEAGRAYDGVQLTYRCSELRDQYGLRFAIYRDTDRSQIASWDTHYGLLDNGQHWVDLASATSSAVRPKTSLEHAKLRALFHEVKDERLVLENSECAVFECKLGGRECVAKIWRGQRSLDYDDAETRYVGGNFTVTLGRRRWGDQHHRYIVRSSDARMLRVGEYENAKEEPFANRFDAINDYTNFELEREFEGGDFMPYGGRETKVPDWLLAGLAPAPLQKTHEFWLLYGGPVVGHPLDLGRYHVVIDVDGVRKRSPGGEEVRLLNHDLDRLEWEDGVVEHVASGLVFSKRRLWKSLRYVAESPLVPRSFQMRDDASGRDYVLAPLYVFRQPKPEGLPFPLECAVEEGLPAYALYENNGAFLVADSRLALLYLVYSHVLRYEYAAAISHVLRIPEGGELEDSEKLLLRGLLRDDEMDLQPDACAFYVALAAKFPALRIVRWASIAKLYTELHDSVAEACRLPAMEEGRPSEMRRVYWDDPDANFEVVKEQPSFIWRNFDTQQSPDPSVGAPVPTFQEMQRKDFNLEEAVYAEHATHPDVNFFLKIVAVVGRDARLGAAMVASAILRQVREVVHLEPVWTTTARRVSILRCRLPASHVEPVDLSSNPRFVDLYRNPRATPEVRAEFEDRLRRLPADRMPLFFNLREEALWIAVLGTALLPAAQGSSRGSFPINHKELMFEFQMGIFLRPEQRLYLETALDEPNVVTQMLMGFGKSAVITPLLCLRIQDLGMTPVVVVPSFLVQQTRGTLFKAFAQGVVRRLNFVHYRRDAERPSFAVDHILCGDPQTFQSMYLEAVRGKKVENNYLYWSGWPRMFSLRTLGWAILDEVDYTLNPISSELNHAVGEPRAFDSWRWELATTFAELVATPEKYPLWAQALRDLEGRVISYPHTVVAREGVYGEYLEAVVAKEVPYMSTYEREVYGQWLEVVLPHCLTKIHQVHFGLRDNSRFAVPYVAKGKPSPNSEFSHPDVVVYFTSLTYLLDGLRASDVAELVRWMQLRASRERGEYDMRPTAATFAAWTGRSLWEVDASNLSPLVLDLRQDSRVVDYYLRRFLYPLKLRSASQKIVSTGSDFTQVFFQRVTAFTGTPSVVPPPLLSLRSESADAEVEAAVDRLVFRRFLLNSSLSVVKRAVALDVDALIDVGALLVGMSNLEVAKTLAGQRRKCAFFDESDALVVWDGRELRKNAKVDDLTVVYYDQAHTTGVHVDLKPDAQGLVTVGVGTPYTRFTQALYRLRKISTTQTATVLVPHHLGDIEDVSALKRWLRGNDELQNRKKMQQLDVHQRSVSLHVQSYEAIMNTSYIARDEYPGLVVDETYDVDVLVTTENLQEQEQEQERETQRETVVGKRALGYRPWTFSEAVRVSESNAKHLQSPVNWGRHPYVLLHEDVQCGLSATEAHVIMQLKPPVVKLVLRAFPFFDIVAGASCGYPTLCGHYNIKEDNTYTLIDQKNFPELAESLEEDERLGDFDLDRSVVESRSYGEIVGARSLASLYPAGISALSLAKHMGALFLLDQTFAAPPRRQKRSIARSYHAYKPMNFTERRGVIHAWGLKLETMGEVFVPTHDESPAYFICKAPASLSYVWDVEFDLPSMAGLDVYVDREEITHRVRVRGSRFSTYGWRREGALLRDGSKGLLVRGHGILERIVTQHEFRYQFLVLRNRKDFVLRDGAGSGSSRVCFRASLANRELPLRVGVLILGGQTVVSFNGIVEHLPFLSVRSLVLPSAERVEAPEEEAITALRRLYPQLPLDRFTLENLPFRILDQEAGVKCGNAALCVKSAVSVVWYGEEPRYAIPYVPGVKSYVIDHRTSRKITEPVRVEGYVKFTLRWRALLVFVRSI